MGILLLHLSLLLWHSILCLLLSSCFLVNTADRIIRVYESGEVQACGKDGEPEPIQKLQDLVNKLVLGFLYVEVCVHRECYISSKTDLAKPSQEAAARTAATLAVLESHCSASLRRQH